MHLVLVSVETTVSKTIRKAQVSIFSDVCFNVVNHQDLKREEVSFLERM